jgi:hypothetical protein
VRRREQQKLAQQAQKAAAVRATRRLHKMAMMKATMTMARVVKQKGLMERHQQGQHQGASVRGAQVVVQGGGRAVEAGVLVVAMRQERQSRRVGAGVT